MRERLWTYLLRAVHLYLVTWLFLGAGMHPLLAATYYVSATGGSDVRTPQQAQNPATPWKTLSRATGASLVPGDIVQVAPGLYDQAGGETFPLNLIDGVALIGAGAEATHVVGPVDGIVFTNKTGLRKGTWLGDMRLGTEKPDALSLLETNPAGVSFDLSKGEVAPTIDDVTFDAILWDGVRISQDDTAPGIFSATLQNNTFASYNGISEEISETGQDHTFAPTITHNTFTGSGNGMYVGLSTMSGNVQMDLDVQGNRFQTGSTGLYTYLYDLTGASFSALIAGNTFTGGGGGVDFTFSSIVQAQNATLPIGMTILDNEMYDLEGDGLYTYLYGIQGGAVDLNATISGNTVNNVSTGFEMTMSTLSNTRVTARRDVRDNTLLNSRDGLYFYEYNFNKASLDDQVTVSGNTFSNIDGGSISLSINTMNSASVTTRWDAHDNIIKGTRYGVWLFQYNFSDAPLDSRMTVSGNTISDTGSNAISGSIESMYDVTGGYRFDVRDNALQNIDSSSIYFGDYYWYGGTHEHDITLAGNTMDGAGSNSIGLSVYGWDEVEEGTLDLRVLDNTVRNASSDGIYVGNYDMTNSNYDGHITIAGNSITGSGSSGIDLSEYSFSGSSKVALDTRILNNEILDSGSDAIYAGHYYLQEIGAARLDTTIAGNTISSSSGDGIDASIYSWSGTPGEQYLTLGGNSVSGSDSDGLFMFLSGQENLKTNQVRVQDNLANDNQYIGLDLESYGFTAPHILVSGNTATLNGEYGAYISGSSANETAVGASADFGGGSLASAGLNSFRLNGEYDLFNALPGTTAKVFARSNFWGTTDQATIDARIFDNEEYEAAAVDFANPLAAPATTAARATLTAAVVQDGGLSGATPGDTLRFTATLTGTGAIGCSEATFAAPLPPGATLVPDSSQTSKGAVIRASDDAGLLVGLGWVAAGDSITVSWDVVSRSDATCTDLSIQGTLTCRQLGDVLTDDPGTQAVDDATKVSWTRATFYADGDQDGFGDVDHTTTVCLPGTPEGYSADKTDCNDRRSDVNPAATEVCDGADNDCDGKTDEGVGTTFYTDADKDGFGDSSTAVQACSTPSGAVTVGGDCDDTDSAIRPDQNEVCNGVDDNCNSKTDEGVGIPFYADGDGDGYGDSSKTEVACSAPQGYVKAGGDCDDANKTIFPGASEICDGKDSNCNGEIDENGPNVYFVDADGDGYGSPSSYVTGCEAPTGYVTSSEDCNDGDSAVHPGVAEVCDGIDNDCSGLIDDADGCGDASPTPPGEVEGGGCSCNTNGPATSPSLGAIGFLGLTAILMRRRRR